MNIVILLIFVLSGFAGLAYELVWTKHLMLIFGVSSQAISTVLAAFMGGLALGSVLIGRFADRLRRPLRFYALLELGIGVSALAIPAALHLVNGAYVSLARDVPAHSWALTVARFLLCFAVLLVPTTLMGGTLPTMSRQFIRREEGIGTGAGLLYGANTLGGIIGVGATGFILLRVLGAHQTTLLAVGVNAFVALAALLLSLRAAPIEQRPIAAAPDAAPAAATAPATARLRTFILIAFGIAGAASLAYEVLWTRVLVYFMDLTIYSFTTILVTFLTGIALGSFLFARLADRTRNLLALFGIIELFISLSAVYLLHTMGKLLLLSTNVSQHLPLFGYTGMVAARFAAAFVFMLLPTILMGAAFPVVTRLYTRNLGTLARSVGDLYAANTVGCVIGSLAAGFVLLRLVGAQQAVGLVAMVNGALGIACLVLSPARRRVLVLIPAAAVLAVGFVLAWRVPPAVTFSPRAIRPKRDLLFHREGPEASLAVLRSPTGSRELNLNGSSTAYSDYGDIVCHKLLAHPPALLARNPTRALIIGFGMGSTAWSLAQYPLEEIDCVELVDSQRESARYFLPENGGVLSDPRFDLIIGDGRNYLLTTHKQYDIISFNAIHPAFSPYLYTREFYQLCRSRLTPAGVICAWVPTNSTYFPSLLRTFHEVFPHCSVWYANMAHLSIVGSIGPQRIALPQLKERMSDPDLRRNLAETHLDHPLVFLSHCIMDEDAVRRYIAEAGARVNSDDLPFVEFDTVLDIKGSAVDNCRSLLSYWTSPRWLIADPGLLPEDASALEASIEKHSEATRLSVVAAIQAARDDLVEAAATLHEAIALCPEDSHVRYMRAVIWGDARWDQLPHLRADSPNEQRVRQMDEVLLTQADTASEEPGVPERYLIGLRLSLARILANRGASDLAEKQIRAVLAADPEVPLARRYLADLEQRRASAPPTRRPAKADQPSERSP
jgi:spermidine synthase